MTQNPHANSPEGLSFKHVQKSNGLLDEVMKSSQSADLIDHIVDTWAVLSPVNPCATNHPDKPASLEIYFLWFSFYKFSVRFREDRKRLCGGKRR